jgi:hypothetical protein
VLASKKNLCSDTSPFRKRFFSAYPPKSWNTEIEPNSIASGYWFPGALKKEEKRIAKCFATFAQKYFLSPNEPKIAGVSTHFSLFFSHVLHTR